MGNSFTSCHRKKKQRKSSIQVPVEPEAKQKQPLSVLYSACKAGKTDDVRELLVSLPLTDINQIEPNGSTALHAACYFDRYDVVKLLLEAGACRSMRNSPYSLTPFDEATTAEIRGLFSRIQRTNGAEFDDRFSGTDWRREWIIESKEAEQWKNNLYQALIIRQPYSDIIAFLREHYLSDDLTREFLSKRDSAVIEWFFDQAVAKNDVKYIVKAYTSVTQFYAMVNNHFAGFLLRFFRWNYDNQHTNTIEKSVGYLASIFVYHPDLRSHSFTGKTHRGMIICEHELRIYTVGKRLLNKSFLSTSTDRSVAEAYAGVGNSQRMRRSLDNNLIQFMVICTYNIINENTALSICSTSEVPEEQEVLIMPLSAFQVKSVNQYLTDDNRAQVEIEVVECVRCNVHSG